jgi:iron complex transport system ATP-binding protein
MISITNLNFAYADAAILKDVSLEIADGDFVGIAGCNGAGKSTLLKCILGINPVDQGRVFVGGDDVTGLERRELARRVAWVPQDTATQHGFTVRAFVEMSRYPYLQPFTPPSAADRAMVELALEKANCTQLADTPMSSLSGGEKQRALIAGALAQEARVLLLDEPATHLDPAHQREVYGLLGKLNAQGYTIVIVSHDVNDVAQHCSTVIGLGEGTVLFNGDVGAFFTESTLQTLYDVRFRILTDTDSGMKVAVHAK